MHVALAEKPAFRGLLAQLLEQQRAHRLRHALLDLEPHDLAEPALEDLLLDGLEQILGLIRVRQLEVRVARDAEDEQAHDLHAGEQRAEVRADDVLERHEVPGSSERHPAREALRHLHAREVLGSRRGVADLDRERQREVRDVREWVRRVDGERRQHREDLRLEELVDDRPLGRRQVAHADEPNAVRRERRENDVMQTASLRRQKGLHAHVDRVELLLRRHGRRASSA